MKPSTTVFKFEEMLKEYYSMLSEQDVQGAAPDASAAPDMAGAEAAGPDAAGGAPMPMAAPVQESSPAFAVLIQLLYDAFINKNRLRLGSKDKEFSNNKARNVDQANIALDIVLRNLPFSSRENYSQYAEKSKGSFEDVDDDTIVEIANLAMKALFEGPKNPSDEEKVKDAAKDPDNPTSLVHKVTPKNANAVYNAIKDYPYKENDSGILQFSKM